MKETSSFNDLIEKAREARTKAYSPYSGYQVGAALKTSHGKIYSGCNIENSSYGATICAERVAIHKAISELGSMEISEICVVTDASPPWPPCGICRQVISEFARPSTKIIAANLQGECKTIVFQELMPEAFTPAHLGK